MKTSLLLPTFIFTFVFTFVFLLPASANAQTRLVGTVQDSSATSLPGANVVILRAADSLLTGFAVTDKQGYFEVSIAEPGEYILRTTFLGYTRPEQPVTITEGDQLIDLDKLTMYPEGFYLDGIEVKGYRIPIRMRGDTMVFDADAFATGPNAVVEDLLRRLPGLSVEPNGAILFRGRPVSEVMVNGKPFFRGNTQLLTQNLDAAAVQNVEVYDRKSAAETISGNDDGREDLTVNLEIKEEAKNQPFGQLYGGAGTDNRYRAGGKVFRIGDQSQSGMIGLANNLNETGFSFTDLMGWNTGGNLLSGTERDLLPLAGRGRVTGENRTYSGGVNYGIPLGDDADFSVAYLLLDGRQTEVETQLDQFTGNFADQANRLLREANNRRYFHNLSVDLEWARDTLDKLEMQLTGRIAGRDQIQDARTELFRSEGTTAYNQSDNFDQERPSVDGRLSYNRRLGHAGRTMEFSQRLQSGNNDQLLLTDVDGLSGTDFPLRNGLREWTVDGFGFETETTLGFTEKLSEKWQLSVDGNYIYSRQQSDNLVTESEGTEMSQALDVRAKLFTPGLSLRRSLEDGFLSFGLQRPTLDWRLGGDFDRKESYNWWAPRIQYSRSKGLANLNLSLQGAPELPTQPELLAFADPRQVSLLRVGNPELSPGFRYDLNGFYFVSDQFSGFSLMTNMGVGYVDNPVGYALSLSETARIEAAENFSHRYEQRAYARISQRIDFLGVKASIEGNVFHLSGPGRLNGNTSEQNNWSRTLGGSLSKAFGEDSFVEVGYRHTVNSSATEGQMAFAARTGSLYSQMEVAIGKRLRWSSNFSLNSFGGDGVAATRNLPLWRSELEVRPFKKQPHYFTLRGVDLLNQNRGVDQRAFPFFVRQTEASVLGRYVLLSFHWKL